MLTTRFAQVLFALLVLVTLSVILPGDLCADPRQRGDDGVFIRQGHHIEWQRASYRNSDGYVLVCWSDTRTGDRDIYGQLISPDGEQMWESTGKPLARTRSFRQEDPDVVAVPGGWILGWFDFRDDSTGDTWVQKIDMNGDPMWTPGGVMLDNFPSAILEVTLRVVSDNNGGAIVAWEDLRSGDEGDIYAQHADANGVRWPETLNVTDMVNGQNGITADNDGNGNMVLAWVDKRDPANWDIYAAKITPDGQLPWGTGAGGVPACGQAGEQSSAKLCPDGAGGCYVAWVDKRGGGLHPEDIYAQRLNSSGQPYWTVGGIAVCDLPNNQNSPRVAASMNGTSQDGLIMVWEDYRVNNQISEVYCEKVSPTGDILWDDDGFKVCGDAGPGEPPVGYFRDGARLTTDMQGGMVCAWEDMRDGDHLVTSADLYMARIVTSGDSARHQCGECGVLVSSAAGAQNQPVMRVDAGTGVFIFYDDLRSGSQSLRYRHLDFTNCDTGDETEIVHGLDGNSTNPKAIAMAPGHVGIVWEDHRLGVGGSALFYQVLDTTGQILKPQNGEFVAPNNTGSPLFLQKGQRLCSDDANGFFVSFEDQRGDVVLIRESHINSAGEIVGSDAGNVVWQDASTQDQGPAFIARDGQGGAYIAWSGYTPAFAIDLYVMRMDAQMQRAWAEPVRLTNSGTDDIVRGLITNNDGYCIVTWQSGDLGNYNVTTARIAPDGTVAWSLDVCDAPGDQDNAVMVSDKQGGAYIAWSDLRNEGSSGRDIYAQHLNSAGEASWVDNGDLVNAAAQNQNKPAIEIDQDLNLYVFWEDFRNGAELDLFGQKLNSGGALQWPSNGKAICIAGGEQTEVALNVEWSNGLYAAWTDNRNYFPDIYATHLTEEGLPMPTGDNYWRPDSGGIVNDFYQRQDAATIADDWHGGMFVAWQDYRASGKEPLVNLWANWINDYTVSVREIPDAAIPREHELSQNYPNPFNPSTQIRFAIPQNELVEISVFNTLGQKVATLVNKVMAAGSYELEYDASELPSGMYFYRLQTPSFQTARKMMLLK